MNRVLLTAIAMLGVGLLLALWRIDHVTNDRDTAQKAADQQQARADSLRNTLNLTRELANDQAAVEATYIEEKQRAETDAENLRRCLADGTCGLRVAATCPVVRMDGARPAAGEPDAGAPELTAAARRAYPALVAGLKQQRAQIVGLQASLTNLHGKCKIGATR
ncbi:prophage endopeptidase [Pseudomonas flavescens]|uniref:Prophage endopeptidase n=1 Tax=Phytopseudomonas flavescens TaxID=29435 RepID=A0A1G7XNM6_9GAMM|nr:lysis system i-spanin subunit Rz [Pseudomonas flavescens]SDG85797.1 prophage endopeptidase [Pseudomonas flavescens]